MELSPPALLWESLPKPAADPATLLSAPVLRAVTALVEDGKKGSPSPQSHTSDALLALDTPRQQCLTLVNEPQTRSPRRVRLPIFEAVALAHALRVECHGCCIFNDAYWDLAHGQLEGSKLLAIVLESAKRCTGLAQEWNNVTRITNIRTDLLQKILPFAVLQRLFRLTRNRVQSRLEKSEVTTSSKLRAGPPGVDIPPPAPDPPARAKKRKATALEPAPPAVCGKPVAPGESAGPVVVKQEPAEVTTPAPVPPKLMPVTICMSVDDAEALAATAALGNTDISTRLDLKLRAFGPECGTETAAAADGAVPTWMGVARVQAASLEQNVAWWSGYDACALEGKVGRVLLVSSQGLGESLELAGVVDCVRPDGLMALLVDLASL